MMETPAKSGFLPAIVSTTDPGRYLVSRRLTKENRLRSGVFPQDPDKADDVLKPILDFAYNMSIKEKFPNIFSSAKRAFDYIFECSGTDAHPHVLLVPSDWDTRRIDKLLNGKHLSDKNESTYMNICRVIPALVTLPTFFSRPDFVGMYTQFSGGRASVFLHNVKCGLSFISSKK